MSKIDFQKLAEPFPPEDLEWRIGQSGLGAKGPWAKVLAYITSRAVMHRLDAVVGPENWKDEYQKGPDGGVVCGISIRCGDEWVTKWDGAENSQIESVKGGLSDSFKRAAVKWAIGRYLYRLEEGWATIADDNDRDAYRGEAKDQSGKKTFFKWYPPRLPDWALPADYRKPEAETKPSEPTDAWKSFRTWVETKIDKKVFPSKEIAWKAVATAANELKHDRKSLERCSDTSVFVKIREKLGGTRADGKAAQQALANF